MKQEHAIRILVAHLPDSQGTMKWRRSAPPPSERDRMILFLRTNPKRIMPLLRRRVRLVKWKQRRSV